MKLRWFWECRCADKNCPLIQCNARDRRGSPDRKTARLFAREHCRQEHPGVVSFVVYEAPFLGADTKYYSTFISYRTR